MRFILFFICMILPNILWATPVSYDIDTARSKVNFIYTLNGGKVTGTIPIGAAQFLLDPANMPASRAIVVLNTARTKGGVGFDTQPLRGAAMLNVAQFPTAKFTSTTFAGSPSDATVTGRLTIKGITRDVHLSAKVLRQAGTDTNDLSRLVVRLNGGFDRNLFALSAMENMVADRIMLDMIVYLNASAR